MPIVGLNIGKSSFRAVELERHKDQIIVNKFGIYENYQLNLESTDPSELTNAAQALKNFFSEVGFTSPEVVVGLDEANVYMRIIKMPNMSDKELKNSIKFEAEQYIPVPINDVNLSFQKLDFSFADKSKMEVQLVAAKKTTLGKYVNLLKVAKLVPRAIEPETIALNRVLGDTKDAPLGTIILEMGHSSTLIIISYGGFVRFSRSIPIGGETLTKAIQQGLNLDFMQAEEYKKAYGMDQSKMDGKIHEVLKPLIDNIALEVSRASLFFTNHNPGASLKRVILTGGTALMPSLMLYMASSLDFEVEQANPLKSVVLSPKLADQGKLFIENGPVYSAAVGLALREV